jgi:hypothetical protein
MLRSYFAVATFAIQQRGGLWNERVSVRPQAQQLIITQLRIVRGELGEVHIPYADGFGVGKPAVYAEGLLSVHDWCCYQAISLTTSTVPTART